jgi:hypothetical protein
VSGLDARLEKMRNAGIPDIALKTFAPLLRAGCETVRRMLPESVLEPVDELADAMPTTCRAMRRQRAARTAIHVFEGAQPLRVAREDRVAVAGRVRARAARRPGR